MKKTLEEYIDVIRRLPIKDKYTKDELQIDDLLIEREKNIEIYYAPHNEYINPNAKIFIVGITPGFEQMNNALVTARKNLEENIDINDIKYKCKKEARFSGSLRKNIISMLDEIELNKALGLNSCSELFNERDDLLHTTALVEYPVFVKGKNYTGHTPKLVKSNILMRYVRENFVEEINKLKDVLIIPLGKAVDEVLEILVHENIIKREQILKGFPHPSGANANRLVQLEENKEHMMEIIREKIK